MTSGRRCDEARTVPGSSDQGRVVMVASGEAKGRPKRGGPSGQRRERGGLERGTAQRSL
jgi:hypothetical protein